VSTLSSSRRAARDATTTRPSLAHGHHADPRRLDAPPPEGKLQPNGRDGLGVAIVGARLLSVIGAMAERLLQYDHGAWAVLVLAATVALGVLRLMLARAA
jgi:hypothetical protein